MGGQGFYRGERYLVLKSEIEREGGKRAATKIHKCSVSWKKVKSECAPVTTKAQTAFKKVALQYKQVER